MKFVSTYLKEYKLQSILAPLFKMLEAVFELLVPLVMASIINKGIAGRDTGFVLRMSGVLVCLAIAGLGFSVVAQYFSAMVAVNCSSKIRRDLFEKILSLSTAQQEKIGSEVLVTRMTSDINQIQSGINMVLRLFLRSPFIVAGAVIMAAIVDPFVTSVFVGVVALLSLVVFLIMRYTLPRYKLLQKKLESVLHTTSENLSGARVLRAFRQEENELNIFNNRVDDLYNLQIGNGKIAALLNPLTYGIVNLGIVVLIYVASIRVNSGVILQGDVVALVNYMSQILIELVKLANLIVLLMKALPSADRVEEIINMKSDERNHIVSEEAIENYDICVKNVYFKYNESQSEVNGELEISNDLLNDRNISPQNGGDDSYDIEDISIDIPQGSVLGIVGGTGSGKSTFLKLLNHTYDCEKGTIEIGGINITKITDAKLSDIFGNVPQKAALFSGTVRKNMTEKMQNASDEELNHALTISQASNFINEKEGKLDALVSQNGSNFSGGQKQRLTIARALVAKPKVVVLDDSASALDLATEAALRSELMKLDWKPTIIIVSQRASSVKNADKIMVLDDGKCVGIGNHSELLKQCSTYEEIYYAQFPREEAENEQ